MRIFFQYVITYLFSTGMEFCTCGVTPLVCACFRNQLVELERCGRLCVVVGVSDVQEGSREDVPAAGRPWSWGNGGAGSLDILPVCQLLHLLPRPATPS